MKYIFPLSICSFKILIFSCLIIVTCSELTGQSQVAKGIVAYYPLDGDATDISGNCHEGTIFGSKATFGCTGEFMTAMSFDGIDDYIEIPHSEEFNFGIEDDYTISFWIKFANGQMDKDTSDNDIISKWVIDDKSMKHEQNGYPFVFRVINKAKGKKRQFYAAQFGGYKMGCKGSTSLQVGLQASTEFHHVLLKVESSKLYLFIDGKMVKRKGSNVFCSSSNEAPIRIGKRGGLKFQNHFKGVVDNLAFYNRALLGDEIELLSNKEFDLKEVLKFSESEGSLISADTLFFNDDIFQLNSAQRMKISELRKYLEIGNQHHIVIKGHTNGLPEANFCDELSLKRAKVVEQYLLDLGVSCVKMTTLGFGKRHQISSNRTPILRKKNQRVEILLYKRVRA